MKHFYFFLIAALSASLLQAQTVNIPDPVFKTKLLSIADTNADGEIQVSEAEAVTTLSFNHCHFGNTIGIQAFTNLQSLTFSSYCDIDDPVDLSGMASIKTMHFTKCGISTINVAGLVNLESLSFGYAGPEFLNLPQAVNLKTVSMYYGGPDHWDLSGLTNLTDFNSQDNAIEYINLEGTTGLINLTISSNNATLAPIDLSDLVNLKKLTLTSTDLTSLDLQHNLQLEELSLHENDLTTLDVSMLTNLKKLSCSGNFLTSLDVSTLTNLTTLSCSSNELSTLDVSNLSNLTGLSCSDNNLSSLNLLNNPNLKSLSCDENQLTEIDLANSHQLESGNFRNNLFTTLDFSPVASAADYVSFEVADNPNLVSVNLKNGREDSFQMNNLNCPNLIYICSDEEDLSDLNWLLLNYGVTGVQVNTYCSFVPGGDYNTFTGTVSIDSDNNGCDSGDFKFPYMKMLLSSTAQNGTTFTEADGHYNFYTESGEFTVTPQYENPYFTISPASITVNFADIDNHVQTENFCLIPNGMHKDLEITLIPLEVARPGFDARYQVAFKNKGNQSLSGSIDLTFNDDVLDFVTANPNTSSQSSNHLVWDYADLLPFENRTIEFTLNVNSPMETPAVNINDILNFSTSISPAEDDETLADNMAILAQTVVGSVDPNDKTCLEGSTMTPEMIGGYLHYLIRFQNSGTYYAENVVVKDIIDTDKFDLSSLQLVEASHPQVTRINGNKVEFIFENINLPAEQDNEPASHGFVTFKIKTKPNLSLNDAVENTADIYFDFNFPIVTNTTSTVVTELGTGEFENTSVAVYPNPVKDLLTISAKDSITSVQVFDIQGRLLETYPNNISTATIDMTSKAKGMYLVKVKTDKGIKTAKIIKE